SGKVFLETNCSIDAGSIRSRAEEFCRHKMSEQASIENGSRVASGDLEKHRRLSLLELSLFLFVWSVCGVAINSANLSAFNLQQAGIEAMVERKQFSLEGSR